MISKICEKSKCTACFACQNICPAGAVTLQPDENGGVYPVISDKCTECNLCVNTCPSLNPVIKNEAKEAFAVFANDGETRRTSTSGGMVYTVCKAFEGIVYGAAFSDGLSVEHIRIENKKDLEKTQGSKYVLSNINGRFKSVKQDLEDGKKVLFTGTPCQVAGLKSYLKKDYENLYTIDFVCHGVPDSSVLKDFIKNETKINNFTGITVRFRDEKGYNMTVLKDGKPVMEIPFGINYYYHAFLEGWNLRENCHSCLYSEINRCSDLTVCDCWGSENETVKKEMKNGLSGVLINTDKGKELFASVKDELTVIESSVNEAKSGVIHLNHPSPETADSVKFRKLNEKHGAYYALKNTKPKKRLIITLRKIKNAGNSHN